MAESFQVRDFSPSPFELAEEVLRRVSGEGLALARGFPLSVDRFVELLSQLGNPLPYYGADPSDGAHPRHLAVHRVRYDVDGARRGAVHAVDGALAIHSAQSLRDPRPRFFAMLMVDPGWLDGAPACNGETILVRWRDTFAEMARRAPTLWRATVRYLRAEVSLTDDVRRPVVYDLPDARDEFDLGVRVKYGMESNPLLVGTPAGAAFKDLLACARAPHVLREGQLYSGDLLVVDNNRVGHGRRAVIGQRGGIEGSIYNPRELWSVTVG